MGRIERITEYYVRVDPQRIGFFPGAGSVSDRLIESDEAKRLEMYRRACEAMVDQIERHVDGVGLATVGTESEDVCDFCGSDWTEGADSLDNGGCCPEDWDLHEAEIAKAEAKS